MLVPLDTPEYLDRLREQSQRLVHELLAAMQSYGHTQRIRANVDLLTIAPHGHHFIVEGFFRTFHDGKMIRFYSNGDLVLAPSVPAAGVQLMISEFAADIVTIDATQFTHTLAASPALTKTFYDFCAHEHCIMQSLCALSCLHEGQDEFALRRFAAGDIIIAEATPALEIFLLVSGTATVSVNDQPIGTIQTDEIFGEMSFLTESPRTATVRAATPCLVQVIDRAHFEALIRQRPHMMMHIAKTLAQRLKDRSTTQNAAISPTG